MCFLGECDIKIIVACLLPSAQTGSIKKRGNMVTERTYGSHAEWYAANIDAIAASGGKLQPPPYLLPAKVADDVPIIGGQIIPFPKKKRTAA